MAEVKTGKRYCTVCGEFLGEDLVKYLCTEHHNQWKFKVQQYLRGMFE